MRMVSYNILDGGREPPGRVLLIRDVIRRLEPDVVGLVEADDPGLVAELAVSLDMKWTLVEAPRQGRSGSGHHAAILSRFPILQSAALHTDCPEVRKAALAATIRRQQGG